MRTGEVATMLNMKPEELTRAVSIAKEQGWIPTTLEFKGPGFPLEWTERDVHVFAMLRILRTNPHANDELARKMLQASLRVLESVSPMPLFLIVNEFGVQTFWSWADTARAVENLPIGYSYWVAPNSFFDHSRQTSR